MSTVFVDDRVGRFRVNKEVKVLGLKGAWAEFGVTTKACGAEVFVVSAYGDVDPVTAPELERELLETVRMGASRVVVDVLIADKRPDPRDSSYGQDYWLHRCEGFTVQQAQRALGKVTGLRFRASIEPELLEVRTGLLGKRLLIPVEQVQQIEPKTRQVIVGASPVAEAGRRSAAE
jgi:hypothetical protein